MKNRILNPSPAPRTTFGLIAWLEQTKIVLPLKGVECSFNVCGDVVSVEIDQIFQQNNAQPLDCLYTFPLPAAAAVYCCEMHINGRVIRAQVEEKQRARELAREKKAAGHRTALVEMERNNLFALSLGNLQPGDLVVIRFAYFQTLTRLGDWTSFHVPFCPGVRYIPGKPLLRSSPGRGVVDDTDQVPDASRISPPRIDRLHPDAASLSVEGTVDHPPGEVKDISSPSHPVFISPAQGSFKVALADHGAMPDCDFVLRWTEVQPVQVMPAGWITRSHGETFAFVRLGAPAHVAVSDTYAQDIYFLLDRSGSMQGLKWQKAVKAFHAFLQTLGKEDRVWATFFESQFRDLAEKPLPIAEVLTDPAVQNLEALGANGGTELLPALEHVLDKVGAYSKDRPASLLFITDGEVGNEAAVLDRLSRHTNLRVHVFGIDVTLNDGFLQKLAAQHHGSSCLMSPHDDIVGAVARLGDRLRRPVLTSIRIPDGWELASADLPDLHAGEILSFPLKAKHSGAVLPGCSLTGPPSSNTVVLAAKLPDGTSKDYRFELAETNAASVHLLWAKRRIEFLLAQGKAQDAIALAKESNLVCEGAAFIAWDETEKVTVSAPDREVYQPSMQADFPPGRARMFLAAKSCFGASPARLEEDGRIFPIYKQGAEEHTFTGRLRELSGKMQRSGWSDGPDITHLLSQMAEDRLFQTATGIELARFLAKWALSAPPGLEVGYVKFVELLNSLQAASSQPPIKRLKIIRQWIELHLQGDQKAQAIAHLDRLKTELGPKAKLPA